MRAGIGALSLLLAWRLTAADVIDVRQGTNLTLAVDPAHDAIVVDLLGGLWRLPMAGGGAIALIPAGSGIAQPRFSPAGDRVYFQRWLDGQWDIWQLSLADGEYRPLTETAANEREPEPSPDGRQLVFASDRSGRYQLWSLDLASGALRQLTDEAGDNRFPAYADTGELAYVNRTGTRSALRQYRDGPTGTPIVESAEHLDAPSWRPGGGVIVFNTRVDGTSSDLRLYVDADEPIERRLTRTEDVFVGRVGWLSPAEYLYAADGQLWRRRIASTERSPVHLFAGASVEPLPPETVTQRLDAPGPHAAAGINGLVRHEASGRQAFSALGDIWLLEDETPIRLTDDAAIDAWPDFSSDGEWIIFASDRGGSLQLWRLQLATGQLLQLTDGSAQAFLPRVSGDGRFVAYLETDGTGPWDEARLKIVAFATPFRSETLASGLFNASELAWQGSRIRVLAGSDPNSAPLARVFDSPAAETTPDPASVHSLASLPPDARPTWQPLTADEPWVIQADRLFDGIRDSYTYLVDIHIEGQRITDIVRRGRLPLPARVVQAEDLTIVPGLIDVHVHQSALGGQALGKVWLRNGVTTVREVMAEPFGALERAEAWASGRQPGPRLVIDPALPVSEIALPGSSPIVVTGGRIARGLAHGLAEQLAQADDSPSALPAILAPARAGSTAPGLAVSTLGRSYQDVISQLTASGAWFPTGLAATGAAAPVAGIGNLTGMIERVMRSSGRVAIGSDAPAVPYGSGFHEELALLQAQGVPQAQILRWATAGGALALGLSLELGTLEPGRIADFVLVDGDPLRNVADLRRVSAVVIGGVWYSRADLDDGAMGPR